MRITEDSLLSNIKHRYTIKRLIAKIISELITFNDCALINYFIGIVQ